MPRLPIALAPWLLTVCVLSTRAMADEPHMWIEQRVQVLFDPNGEATGLRDIWVFDANYSASAVEGLEQNNGVVTSAALAKLAKVNITSLAEYHFMTFVKSGDQDVAVSTPADDNLTFAADTKRLTLSFVLPFVQPVKMSRPLSIEITDKTDFVDFEAATRDPIKLVSSPAVCRSAVHRAAPCRDDDEACQTDWAHGFVPERRVPDLMLVSCP